MPEVISSWVVAECNLWVQPQHTFRHLCSHEKLLVYWLTQVVLYNNCENDTFYKNISIPHLIMCGITKCLVHMV